MDCIQALEAVSAAMDREVVDAALLGAAKEHCRHCPECGSFVSALLAMKRTAPPQPPEDLADRIVATVGAERLRNERAATALAAAERSAQEREVAGPAPHVRAVPTTSLKERLMDPRRRRAVVAWSSAAAVALVAAGFGAVYGTRAIMTDKSVPQRIVLESDESANQEGGGTFGNTEVPQGETLASPGAAQSQAASLDARTAAGMIVVDGTAYRAAGTDTSVSRASLTPRGSVTTALGPNESPAKHDALGTDDPSRVFIDPGDGSMLAFDRVTTSYEGRTYVLQSGPITEWGSAAVLPADIGQPVTADGSPVFQPVDAAKTVFVRRGTDASTGIAYPPGARSDVASGWSWWIPASSS